VLEIMNVSFKIYLEFGAWDLDFSKHH